MRNFKLLLAYDGSRYRGWQRLADTDNTIQGKLEAVLSRMVGKPVEVIGSGRTDAGAHAQGQTANFHCETTMSASEIRAYLRQYLHQSLGTIEFAVLNSAIRGDGLKKALAEVEKVYLLCLIVGQQFCHGLAQAVFCQIFFRERQGVYTGGNAEVLQVHLIFIFIRLVCIADKYEALGIVCLYGRKEVGAKLTYLLQQV